MNDQPDCYWRCLNCGQVYFGSPPPDLCDFCRDFTTWAPQTIPSAETEPDTPSGQDDDPPLHQPRLFED